MMIQDFFTPIDTQFLDGLELSDQVLGVKISKYISASDFPNVEDAHVVIFDVAESRGGSHNEGAALSGNAFRAQFFPLYLGNWSLKITDLGTIKSGNTLEDTYFAVQETISFLIKKGILPIIIGGSKDLIYGAYKAYYKLDQIVNLAIISPEFSIGEQNLLPAKNYMSRIVLEQPSVLFNYTNIGFQTFFNAQEEIALVDKMGFEAYRIGEMKNITLSEPILRDADLVAIDVSSIKSSYAPGNYNANPNGLDGEQICSIARYSGISDKVSCFGIYEFNKLKDINNQTAKLLAQIVWYFLEGYSLRAKDYPFCDVDDYLKYTVLFEGEEIKFYQSHKTGRWWMQLNIPKTNSFVKKMLISCTEDDYKMALNEKMPERWFKAQEKL